VAKFLKDVIKPGTVRLPDGRKVTFTRQDVDRMRQRVAEMAAAGLQVPVAWNHQDAGPMSAADILASRAKHVIGHASGAALDGGTLAVTLDVDDADARQLARTKYVSPEIIWDYVDGTGRKWDGPSITHIAVTGRPVDPHQQPFIQLSQDASPRRVRLSMEDLMADDADKGGKKGEEEGGGGGDLAAVCDALRETGMSIPDEVMDFAGLVIAIKASTGTGTEPDGDGAGGGDMDGITEAESPVLMSMEKDLLAYKRKEQEQRIKALFPSRIDGKRRDEMLADLGKAQLSMDRKAGKLRPTTLEAEIAAYEKLSPRQFKGASPVRLSHDGTSGITEAAPPAGIGGDADAIRAEAKKTAERYSAK
jgi:hypothetical protein